MKVRLLPPKNNKSLPIFHTTKPFLTKPEECILMESLKKHVIAVNRDSKINAVLYGTTHTDKKQDDYISKIHTIPVLNESGNIKGYMNVKSNQLDKWIK